MDYQDKKFPELYFFFIESLKTQKAYDTGSQQL